MENINPIEYLFKFFKRVDVSKLGDLYTVKIYRESSNEDKLFDGYVIGSSTDISEAIDEVIEKHMMESQKAKSLIDMESFRL